MILHLCVIPKQLHTYWAPRGTVGTAVPSYSHAIPHLLSLPQQHPWWQVVDRVPTHVAVAVAAAREHVVGWYSTGPRLREADLAIHQLMSNYVSTPVLVICEVEVRGQEGYCTACVQMCFNQLYGTVQCSAAHAAAETSQGRCLAV